MFILAYCRQVTHIKKVHTGHLSCVVLVDIFWKIQVVSVVDLVCFEYTVKELRFFPRKLGCDGFPWNHYMQSDGFFSKFHVFFFIFQFTVFYLLFFLLSKKVGEAMAPWSPRQCDPWLRQISLNFKTSYCNLKTRCLGTELCVPFLLFSFWKKLWCFKVQEFMYIVEQNI